MKECLYMSAEESTNNASLDLVITTNLKLTYTRQHYLPRRLNISPTIQSSSIFNCVDIQHSCVIVYMYITSTDND